MSEVLFQPFPMAPGRRAQVWRHRPEFRRPRHFHPEPEINLVVKGNALLGVGDRSLALGAGDLVVFAPGQDHVLLEASADLELFVMALHPELAARIPTWSPTAAGSAGRLAEHELVGFTTPLHALADVSDAGATETTLTDLFGMALRRSNAQHVLSRRAMASVREELSLSSGDLAKRLRTTASAISRRFHQDFGLTFVEYRSRLRLIRFVELVDAGRSLTRAALDAEFGSYAQCHRVFQRALGCSPQAYFRGARGAIDAARLEAVP